MAEQFGAREVGSTVQPCPSKTRPKPVHWVEIELIGEDGKPIPGEAYRVTLPNGDVARGYLDQEGRAKVENIEDPGACQIAFPDLDAEAWDPVKP